MAAAASWVDPATPPVVINEAVLAGFATASTRCISFDLDGTLWPPAGPVLARASLALNDWLVKEHPAIASRHEGDVGLDTLMGTVLASRPDISHCYTALRTETLRQAALDARAAGAEVADPDAVASAGIRVFRRARSAVTPYPGVVEMLATLREAGVRVVTLTNGNADVGATPLAGMVDASVSATSVGSAKPSRAMFETAVEAVHGEASNCLHVGDDPDSDVRGARRAGMRAILVVPPEGDGPTDGSHAQRVRKAADAQLAADEDVRADAVVGHASDLVPLLHSLGAFGSTDM